MSASEERLEFMDLVQRASLDPSNKNISILNMFTDLYRECTQDKKSAQINTTISSGDGNILNESMSKLLGDFSSLHNTNNKEITNTLQKTQSSLGTKHKEAQKL